MGSARKTPLDFDEYTYGNNGWETYAEGEGSLFEDDTDVDMVSASKGHILTVQPGIYNDKILFSGGTANNDYFRWIRGSAAGNAEACVFNYTGALGTNGAVVSVVGENAVAVSDLTLRYNGTSAGHVLIAWVQSVPANAARFVGVRFGPSQNLHASSSVSGLQAYTGGSTVMIDCIMYSIENAGVIRNSGVSFSAHNCTLYGMAYGFWAAGSGGVVKNCITQNITADYTNVWTKTTCVENDSVVFKNAGVGDFRLASSDTAAKGQGTDLSADFDDDYLGSAWAATWDIGAIAYQANYTYQGSASDGLSVGASVQAACVVSTSCSDGVVVSESVLGGSIFQGAAQDGVAIADAVMLGAVFNVSLQDGILMSDAVMPGAVFNVSLQDGILMSDAVMPGAVFNVSLQDGILVSDAVILSRLFSGSVQDGVTIQEEVSGLRSIFAEASDSIRIGDSLSVLTQFSVTASDGMVVSDTAWAPTGGSLVITVTCSKPEIDFSAG